MRRSHVALLCGWIVLAPHLPAVVALVVGVGYLWGFWSANKAGQ